MAGTPKVQVIADDITSYEQFKQKMAQELSPTFHEYDDGHGQACLFYILFQKNPIFIGAVCYLVFKGSSSPMAFIPVDDKFFLNSSNVDDVIEDLRNYAVAKRYWTYRANGLDADSDVEIKDCIVLHPRAHDIYKDAINVLQKNLSDVIEGDESPHRYFAGNYVIGESKAIRVILAHPDSAQDEFDFTITRAGIEGVRLLEEFVLLRALEMIKCVPSEVIPSIKSMVRIHAANGANYDQLLANLEVECGMRGERFELEKGELTLFKANDGSTLVAVYSPNVLWDFVPIGKNITPILGTETTIEATIKTINSLA